MNWQQPIRPMKFVPSANPWAVPDTVLFIGADEGPNAKGYVIMDTHGKVWSYWEIGLMIGQEDD